MQLPELKTNWGIIPLNILYLQNANDAHKSAVSAERLLCFLSTSVRGRIMYTEPVITEKQASSGWPLLRVGFFTHPAGITTSLLNTIYLTSCCSCCFCFTHTFHRAVLYTSHISLFCFHVTTSWWFLFVCTCYFFTNVCVTQCCDSMFNVCVCVWEIYI